MSSNCDQETVPTPPAAKRRKISNSDGETNSVSHENHSGDQVIYSLVQTFLYAFFGFR